MPSLNPPHKQTTDYEHRVGMLQLATIDNPAFTVSLIESKRAGISYAINTLIDLSALYPDTHWYWIIGLDAFQTLPSWYRGHELAQMCDWLIAPRLLGGETIAQSELICKQVAKKLSQHCNTINWRFLHIPLVGVSSSLIRQLCHQHQSISDLVPQVVSSYISTHQLYTHNSE